MQLFKSVLPFTALVLAIGTSMAAGDAQAATQIRQTSGGPTDICQSALPTFDGNIRKRPLAVQNEGTANAFVTCSFPTAEGRIVTTSNTTTVFLYAKSNDSNVHSLTCTGVSGYLTGPNEFVTKTISLDAAGSLTGIIWFAGDFAGSPTVFPSQGQFSASCNLEPGVALGVYFVNGTEDVGN